MSDERELSGDHAPSEDDRDTPLGKWSELSEADRKLMEAWKPVPDDHPLYRGDGVHLFFVRRPKKSSTDGGAREVTAQSSPGPATEMIRQGDVLLVRVSALPNGASEDLRDGVRVVLTRSERTGHAHVISRARLFALGDSRYLDVQLGAVLAHPEHDPIDVPPGTWEVRLQRQFAPAPLRWGSTGLD